LFDTSGKIIPLVQIRTVLQDQGVLSYEVAHCAERHLGYQILRSKDYYTKNVSGILPVVDDGNDKSGGAKPEIHHPAPLLHSVTMRCCQQIARSSKKGGFELVFCTLGINESERLWAKSIAQNQVTSQMAIT
jgi:hypothetical protein